MSAVLGFLVMFAATGGFVYFTIDRSQHGTRPRP